MQTRPKMHIRTVYLTEDTLRRVNVLAERERLSATAIYRAIIEDGLASYEAAHGPIRTTGVSLFASERPTSSTSADVAA